MTFLQEMDPLTGLVDHRAVRDKGKDLAERYGSGDPFPHIVIDDFLPRSIVDRCLAEFDVSRNEEQTVYNRAQERHKRELRPDEMTAPVRQLFYSFNSRPFIQVLENISGIRGLVPDPYFLGGGFHEITNGGHLSIHADFNHHRLMNLERRINLLIYLNEDWKAEYGGELELWTTDMSERRQAIVPVINRAVMFNTTSFSNHGNPQPVNHPGNVSRKSIALYYYTATWSEEKRSHSTQFRPRGGTGDRPDWQVRRRELYEDLVPLIVRRKIAEVRSARRRG